MFSIIAVKALEPLVLMTKHTKFSEYYQKIDRKERASSLQGLLVHFDAIVEAVLHGNP